MWPDGARSVMKVSISMHSASSAFVHYWPNLVERWLFGRQESVLSVSRVSVVTMGDMPSIVVDWITSDNRPVERELAERLDSERDRWLGSCSAEVAKA